MTDFVLDMLLIDISGLVEERTPLPGLEFDKEEMESPLGKALCPLCPGPAGSLLMFLL